MVTGSRGCVHPASFIARYLDEFVGDSFMDAKFQVECLIVGDAAGPDDHAIRWADFRGVKIERFAANWEKLGKAAGPIRNRTMVVIGKPTHCVAFWDGESRGTLNAIQECTKRNVSVFVVPSGHAATTPTQDDARMPKPQVGSPARSPEVETGGIG